MRKENGKTGGEVDGNRPWYLNRAVLPGPNMDPAVQQAAPTRGQMTLNLAVDEDAAPAYQYQERWGAEFREYRHDFGQLKGAAVIIGSLTLLAFVLDALVDTKDHAICGMAWSVLVYSPEMVLSIIAWGTVAVLSLASLRAFAVRHYQTLAMVFAGSAVNLWILQMALVELRRFQCELQELDRITFHKLDYSSFPRRKCTDLDPATTMRNHTFFWEPGCMSSMTGAGGSLSILLGLLACMPQFELSPLRARWVTLATCTNFTVLSVLVGWAGANMASILFLLLSCGCFATLLCDVQWRRSREEFATYKGILFASERRRRLLHTLIPPNVLDHMPHSSHAKLIPVATIMFCRISLTVNDEQVKSPRQLQKSCAGFATHPPPFARLACAPPATTAQGRSKWGGGACRRGAIFE